MLGCIINKFKEILYSPGVLNLSNDITDSLSAALNTMTKPSDAESTQATTEKEEDKKEEKEPEIKDESEPQEDKKEDEAEENKEAVEKTGENEEKKEKPEDGKEQEEYNKIVKNLQDAIQDAKKNITAPEFDKEVGVLEKVFESPLEADIPSFVPVKCVESIGFSVFNPAPSSAQLKGDLFYLKVKTLEGPEYVITSNVKGFFVNNSNENVSFDPNCLQRGNPCFSHSLVGLLCQLSSKFSDKLEEHINKILKTDPFYMSQTTLPTKEWLSNHNGTQFQVESFKYENEEAVSGFYGMDSKGSRDWNEEFQVCKDLPTENVFQRIQRDRAFNKIYYDFIEAAKKGAVAIVNKSIPALNPMDDEHQHVFVYNQIFFSFAVDNKENYKDVSSTDSNPTYTATNHDLLGLRTLQVIDIDGLHIIATCHINYRGYRVIAQSIIPGILTNTDQNSLTEYGSVDDGQTIHSNEEFNELMKKLCEHLAIKECTVVDGEGKEHLIAGSIDVKGIRGTDKRKYLLDLVRLTPRDANYLGKNYTSCLVRPELVRIFQKTKDIEYATQKLKEEYKDDAEEEKKETSKEENKDYFDMTEEEKKEAIAKNQKEMEDKKQKQIQRLQAFDKYLKEAPQFKYNLNVLTNTKLAEGDYKEDEKAVRELSSFITENTIPKLIKSFEAGENVPTDNESISEIFHTQGLNIRYLGKVADSIEEGKLPHIKTLLERSMVCRSAGKLFNEMIRSCADSKGAKFIAHILNILFAPQHIIHKLDEGQDLEEEKVEENKTQKSNKNENHSENKGKKGDKKNKKRNKNKNQNSNGPEKKEEKKLFEISSLHNKNFRHLVEDNKNAKLFKMKPKEFYNKIVKLVKKRYSYDLDPELTNLSCRKSLRNKFAFLRDFCRVVGIKIHSRNYSLEEVETSATDKPCQLPFNESDIVEVIPIIKNIDIVNYDYKTFINTAKSALKEGYYEQAFEYLNQAINVNLQIAGPINKEAVTCLSKLSNIHFKFGDYNQAVQLQTKCVILTEKLFGKVHAQTAQAYASLAQITTIANYTKSFEYMNRALYIYELVCGDYHPEISATYLSLGFMYLEINDIQSAVKCFDQALSRNTAMYGEEHIQVANCYQIIASAHQNSEDFRQALEYQEKSHKILTKLFKEDDTIVKNSLATIDQFTKLSVQKEMVKKIEQQSKFSNLIIFRSKTFGIK